MCSPGVCPNNGKITALGISWTSVSPDVSGLRGAKTCRKSFGATAGQLAVPRLHRLFPYIGSHPRHPLKGKNFRRPPMLDGIKLSSVHFWPLKLIMWIAVGLKGRFQQKPGVPFWRNNPFCCCLASPRQRWCTYVASGLRWARLVVTAGKKSGISGKPRCFFLSMWNDWSFLLVFLLCSTDIHRFLALVFGKPGGTLCSSGSRRPAKAKRRVFGVARPCARAPTRTGSSGLAAWPSPRLWPRTLAMDRGRIMDSMPCLIRLKDFQLRLRCHRTWLAGRYTIKTLLI